MIDPGRTAGSAPAELSAESAAAEPGADMTWQLAINIIAAWRSTGGDRHAVAERLAAGADKSAEAVAEQAVLGLADVAGMFMELYADRRGVSPDDVLQDAASLPSNKGLWG